MSTATITFYKSTKIQSTRNMKIDDLEAYLSTKTSLVKEKVQYQKTCNLEFNIKLNLSQTWIDFLPAYDYDYCKILNTGSTKALYYFITKRSWKSENTIEFHVVLDTINSFSIGKNGDTADYLISQRTNVLREHKNRWKRPINENPEFEEDYYYESTGGSGIGWKIITFSIDTVNYDPFFVGYGKTTNDVVVECLEVEDSNGNILEEGVDYE